MKITQVSQAPAPLRVLIVDDNPDSAKTMGWAVESWGHEVRLEFSGSGALDAAGEFQPQAVLLDIGMPGMNGYELCQIMRQSPELRNTIFIAQTGWSQEQHRQMSREAGFDHYLVKPIDFNTLQRLLTSVTVGKVAN